MDNTANPYSYGYSGTNANQYPTPQSFQPSIQPNNLRNPNAYMHSVIQPLDNQFNPAIPFGSIRGRFVNNVEDIAPSEVPMDKSLSLFPMSDYSCIYAKQWQPDGTITTIKYVPEMQNVSSDTDKSSDNVTLDQLSQQLNNIEHMLKRQHRPKNHYYKKNQNGTNFHKKEVDND